MKCLRIVVALAVFCLLGTRALAGETAGAAADSKAFRFGLVAGANVARFAFDEPRNLFVSEDHYKSRIGFLVGPQVRVPLGTAAFLQSGVLLDVKGYKFDYNGLITKRSSVQTAADRTIVKEALYYATIPLHAGIARPFGRVRLFLQGGPELSYLITARSSGEISEGGHTFSGSYTSTELYSAFELGIGGRAGVDVPFSAGVGSVFFGYSHGLSNINDSFNRSTHHIHNRVWRFGAGWWF